MTGAGAPDRPHPPAGEPDLAALAALIADRTRAAFLLALLGGAPLPASVLAERAGVSRSLASGHLRRLAEGGLVRVEPRGRQRLYRLAGEPIAGALEALLVLAPPTRLRGLRQAVEAEQMRAARLCFDHLGGRLGVAVADALRDSAIVVAEGDDLHLASGADLSRLGLGLSLRSLRRAGAARPAARGCRDWSERPRVHLAGALGAALTARMLARRWLVLREGTRIVRVTPRGLDALRDRLGVAAEVLTAPSPV